MLKSLQNVAWMVLFACLVVGWVAAEWQALEQAPKSVQYKKGSTAYKNQSDQDAGGPWLVIFYVLAPNGLKKISDYCNRYSENEKKNWPQAYYCDLKVTDVYIAVFTALLAIFTVALFAATTWLACLTRQAINLTRSDLVANYRPLLRVRNVIVNPADPTLVDQLGLFQPNQYVAGEIFVTNVGGTPAQITNSHCIVFWGTRGLPMRRPYEGQSGNGAVPVVRLVAGQSVPGFFRSEKRTEGGEQTIGGQVAGRLRLFVMGWVEYRDNSDILRRTAFCREFPAWPLG